MAPPPRPVWPGFVVVTAIIAVWSVVVLFTASMPRVTSSPRGCPAANPRDDVADHDARLARVSEHLASTRERVNAAREQLAAARRRFEWTARPEFPQPDAAAAAGALDDQPAPSPPKQQRDPPNPGETTRNAAIRPRAPRVTALSAWRGPAGKRISVDGSGFSGTSRVLFAAPVPAHAPRHSPKGWHDAAFRVRDDSRLIVTVPDLGPLEQRPLIVVITPRGAAVALPPETPRVSAAAPARAHHANAFHVPRHAALSPPRGAPVLVDRGGSVLSPSASLVIVRAGGGVERATTDCLIIRETPRPQPRDLLVTPVLDVPAINPCFLDVPIQYAGH